LTKFAVNFFIQVNNSGAQQSQQQQGINKRQQKKPPAHKMAKNPPKTVENTRNK
jgi:hypothetical protein